MEGYTIVSQTRRRDLHLILIKLKLKFVNKSDSWLKRCLLRLKDVEEVSQGVWKVKGRLELGDCYSEYFVKLSNGRYFCSCYSIERPYSKQRRRTVCSHVGAVVAFRELTKLELY